MDDCVFCKIVKGEVPSDFEYESNNLIAVKDIKPSADVHILIIPKVHIETLLDLSVSEKDLLSEMIDVAKKLIEEKKIKEAYKLVFNGGKYQYVPHLHLHVLGGEMKNRV